MELFPQNIDLGSTKQQMNFADTLFARVAIERGIDRMGGLTYIADERAQIGQRVIVPVGRGNTQTGGVIVELGNQDLLDGYNPNKVKPISEYSGIIIPQSLLEHAKWMSTYYMCPLGMVFASMIPSAVKANTGMKKKKRLQISTRTPSNDQLGALSTKTREAWEAVLTLSPDQFPIDPKLLQARINHKSLTHINKLTRAELLEEVEIKVIVPPKQFQLLDAGSSGSHTLNESQQQVVDGISKSLGTFAAHLLYGITGSGKTEVYIKLIEQTIAMGKQAIVLVPEISLTPQTAGRFVHCFSEHGVAVLHSGLTKATRNQQWALAASGEAQVVVGARSAVFAPLDNVGLIIVDEEHDSSYKQDQLPRYNARDAAVKRAHIENCPVVLGSATPSIESWFNAKSKRYQLWSMKVRATGGQLPKVQTINMVQDNERMYPPQKKGSQPYSIGRTLANELSQCIRADKQAILLLNRRGFASVVVSSDRKCGWKLECSSCDSTMVVHRGSVRTQGGKRFVRCHHCQSERQIPKSCPMSGKPVVELGVGTQRAEEEIVERFGDSLGLQLNENFVRVDADTMKHSKDYFDVLDRFANGQIKLLLGTQMIAKGLDFPNVSLVGVLNADTALSLPDFRAEERTYQLISQVAGRSGRGKNEGKVIVQTLSPGSASITRAARHDYEGFANDELNARRIASLPPTQRMVRLIIRDPNHEVAHGYALELSEQLRAHAHQSVQVIGPMPCTISRIADHFRWAIEMLAPSPMPIQNAMHALREKGLLKSDARVAVDVDPVWLM